jgi:kinesin family protein 4/21/27
MRLQEVLKERETEIRTLEESLKESQSKQAGNYDKTAVSSPSDKPDAISNDVGLSPKTLNHFDHIKQSMVNGNAHAVNSDHGSNHSESDESLERLNELMLYVLYIRTFVSCVLTDLHSRSMAQKESQHREIVDELNAELTQTRRQLDELTALSRDQVRRFFCVDFAY